MVKAAIAPAIPDFFFERRETEERLEEPPAGVVFPDATVLVIPAETRFLAELPAEDVTGREV